MVSGYTLETVRFGIPRPAWRRRTRKAQEGIVTAEWFQSQTVEFDPEISPGLLRAKRQSNWNYTSAGSG